MAAACTAVWLPCCALFAAAQHRHSGTPPNAHLQPASLPPAPSPAVFGGGYWWWTRRRRTAPAAGSPAKPGAADVEKGLGGSPGGKVQRGSSTPSSGSWSDAGSGTKRLDSRSSKAASMPASPSLPRRGGSSQPSPPRSGSSASGGSPPGSTAGIIRTPSRGGAASPAPLRSYALPVLTAGGQRTSTDNPLWVPPASPGGVSSRSLGGGWTATDNPLSADGSEGGSSGSAPLACTTSNVNSSSSRRLARTEGASGSGGLAGRALPRTVSAPGGPLTRTTSGVSSGSAAPAGRPLPRTGSGVSLGSARPLARTGSGMGSGDFAPERSGPSDGSLGGSMAGSWAGSSSSKFAQKAPARGKFVGAPAKALRYAQPAGRTPASASTKSFNARTAPPKEPLQRQPSKLDRLRSQGSGQAGQLAAAAAEAAAEAAPARDGSPAGGARASQ